MAKSKNSKVIAEQLQTPRMLKKREKEVLKVWMEKQLSSPTLRLDLLSKEDLEKESEEFLNVFTAAISSGEVEDIDAPQFRPITRHLQDLSKSRALLGFNPSETAVYIFSLKDTLLEFIQKEYQGQPEIINREMIIINQLLDKLGMITFETYAQGREELITRQKDAFLEMATPLMVIWKNILLLPLVGTLDSQRAQLVMEMGLKKISETESKVVILDILGVPAVDTAVANHIIKITKATKLMGCDCILSGMSPDVAQSITQLGVDIGDLITRTTLKDALEYAFRLQGVEVAEGKVKR
ncbi:MAG: STAS domain-containing protein [Candidatus Caldatribacteriota bacterium]|nr:STAS domain-containing protein [Candidatus Caldatribacteriota bacterium]